MQQKLTTTKTNNTNINNDPSSPSSMVGEANTSIHDIYERLGVQPPNYNTARVLNIFGIIQLPISRWSWKIHGHILPILHFFDYYGSTSTSSRSRSSRSSSISSSSPRRRRPPRPPPDVFVNLRVLWCKLLSSLDPNSLAYEGQGQGRFRRWQQQLKDEDEDEDNKSLLPMLHYHATYRMLSPSPFKWTLRYLNLWKLFPRWMHANIELRTVYINNSLKKVIITRITNNTNASNPSASTTSTITTSEDNDDEFDNHNDNGSDNDSDNNICFIILGGGYDPRGAKLAAATASPPSPPSSSISYDNNDNDNDNDNRQQQQQQRSVARRRIVYELDLPVVVESKQWLLRRAGFNATTIIDNDYDNDEDEDEDDSKDNNNQVVRLIPIDLNDDIAVDYALTKIQNELININISSSKLGDGSSCWHVVVISEAVLMYLKPGKADRILKSIAEKFGGSNNDNDNDDNGIDDGDDSSDNGGCFVGASFVFADRLIRYSNTNNDNNNKDGTAEKSKDEEESDISQWLSTNGGWKLQEFLLKPGATRHLGIATTK
ncbi:MAG: hypothetical protein ACI8RD_009657 [Bacillariaceae sp.]